MNAKVSWLNDLTFVGESESGHTVVMSADREKSPSPLELVALGLGGCSSIDVVSILQKGRHAIEDCSVDISYERAETAPRVYTKMHLHFVVSGTNLSEDAVKRAVSLSADKYCSVSKMLDGKVQISHDYEIKTTNSSLGACPRID